ncbi:hypothetical protein [Actinomycetospora soli]|uniref:hypothetical protein n=1 Tax=Actinomycetospora soli TaxID=2893887 RepID=UPI001E4D0EEA|nr:hypothetical protein [Actinomycetospora soli]MCD2189251.1 hypothetical protein [Actinomycetospora soli]
MDALRMLWGTPHDEAVDLTDLAVVDHAEELGRRHVSSLPEVGSRVRASDGGRFVLARDRHDDADDPEVDAAVRLDVVDTRDDGRRTRTRVRSWRGAATRVEGARAWVLVDVEVLAPRAGDGTAPAVPDFVPWLLARVPGSCGGVPLTATVLRRTGAAGGAAVRALLDRHRPVVVIGGVGPDDPGRWRRVETAAHQVARAVAGLAPVVLVDAEAADALGRALPPGGMRVWPGDGRVVPLGPDEVARPTAAARTALEVLRPGSSRVPAPSSLRPALDRLGPQVPDELVEKMAEVPRDRYPFDP